MSRDSPQNMQNPSDVMNMRERDVSKPPMHVTRGDLGKTTTKHCYQTPYMQYRNGVVAIIHTVISVFMYIGMSLRNILLPIDATPLT